MERVFEIQYPEPRCQDCPFAKKFTNHLTHEKGAKQPQQWDKIYITACQNIKTKPFNLFGHTLSWTSVPARRLFGFFSNEISTLHQNGFRRDVGIITFRGSCPKGINASVGGKVNTSNRVLDLVIN